jgi:hypothetical protein
MSDETDGWLRVRANARIDASSTYILHYCCLVTVLHPVHYCICFFVVSASDLSFTVTATATTHAHYYSTPPHALPVLACAVGPWSKAIDDQRRHSSGQP